MSVRGWQLNRRQCLTCLCALLSILLLAAVDAQAQSDLALTKTVSNATPNVGNNVTFTITLTNNGPTATATNVAVTDLLPAGLTFVSATPSQGTYSSTTGVWTVGNITTGAPQTLTITATVVSSAPRTNTATITASDQVDPNTANNAASATETPQQADLSLAKVVSNPTPNVGTIITFTITLTDNGPDTATNVAVSDLLPAGLTFVSATASQGVYSSATGVWTVGTVTGGVPRTLTITATVVSPSARTNTATISFSDQFDPDSANNTASATETPLGADLAVTKTVSNPTPNVGSTITFTITLTNAGPSTTATNVAVTDLLPAGLTFVSATPSQGTYTPATGVWNVGSITTGAPQTLQIQATVVSPSARTNTATISASDLFDPSTANNTASATETPLGADLAVTKAISNATPNVGSTITFTVTLTNNGPSPATGVTVTDLLPAGLTFVSATPSQGSYTSATGVWTVGTIITATSQTLQIQATVVSPAPRTNTATISASDQFDPNTANNTASATETPPGSDLAVAKTVSSATPTVGSTVTFTITLTNAGPATATGVTVTDLLPAGLTFVSATPSQGSYTSATGVWTVGTITTGTPQTLAIVATVTGSSAMTNTGTISASDQFDPNTPNNTASATVTPPAAASADLSLAKTVNNATPTVGSTVTFTITLTNNGPTATATGVVVTDLLPAGLTFVSATPSQGTYTSASGVWSVGTITAPLPQTLAIVATVTGVAAMSNTATITASAPGDPVPGNNTATVTVTPASSVPTLPPGVLILLMGILAFLAIRSLQMRRGSDRG